MASIHTKRHSIETVLEKVQKLDLLDALFFSC